MGYRIDKNTQLELVGFNLFGREDSAIDYYGDYNAESIGGALGSVSGRVFHPIEPRTFRLVLISRY
jgi:hypothetical protein